MTIDEGIKTLASLAEKRGYITYREINDIFPEICGDEMDEVYIKLRTLDIDIRDLAPEQETDQRN
jgi:hypothetical protein